jgi:Na+-transporting methylmalonyl-CoA/oxaloacetate decarboxylase gamma subunit
VTFVLYGLLPLSLVTYVMGAPARRRAIKARERAELAAASTVAPDTDSQAPTDTITPVRKET